MNKHYAGWNTKEHLGTFGFWNGMGGRLFQFLYGNFQEIRYLRQALTDLPDATVLDVGCATGTTYRLLNMERRIVPGQYSGVDLSEPAICEAKRLYPEADFTATSVGDPLPRAGIVVSRDTVLHQSDPYGFLRMLMGAAENTLIVRLRTRDTGATELDTEQSCQMHYDKFWMPYIVLNTDELVEEIAADPRVNRITLNRSYEVLGGQNFRFLPKDLYFTAAGAAETAIRIDMGPRTSEGPEVIYETRLEGQAFRRANRSRYYALTALDRIRRRFTSS